MFVFTGVNTFVNIMNYNYIYKVNVNQWAVMEFLNSENIKPENAKKIKIEHLYLLFGIVRLFTNKNAISIIRNDIKFVLMTDNFITSNLPFTKCGNRQLKTRISILKHIGLIEVFIENENTRYVSISSKLMYLLGCGSIDISPVTEVKKYLTKEFNKLYNQYKSKFIKSKLDELIKKFDDELHYQKYMEKENYNVSLIEVLHRLTLYLEECFKNPKGYTKQY